jgi:FMN-dependent NADH-azoreductase
VGDRRLVGRTNEESRPGEQRAALALAAMVTAELIAADALLFAAPLYRVGVSRFCERLHSSYC